MTLKLSSDRTPKAAKDVKFGFTDIANELAKSIISATDGDGLVIGIEGVWGSGKSTLMNELHGSLNASSSKNTHVITIAPWLMGDPISVKHSLLQSIFSVLKEEEDCPSSRILEPVAA